MAHKNLLVFLFLFILNGFAYAQNQHLTDSLEAKLKDFDAYKLEMRGKNSEMDDTIKVNILYDLSRAYWDGSYEKGMQYARFSLDLANQLNYKRGIEHAWFTMGVINYIKGNPNEAMEQTQTSLKIALEIKDKQGVADAYINIGNIYGQNNYAEALKYYFTSLKIAEAIGYKKGILFNYMNIGVIYSKQDNKEGALKYVLVASKIAEQLGDHENLVTLLINLGMLYHSNQNYDSARYYYSEALKINQQFNNQTNLADINIGQGLIYIDELKYSEALKKYFAALDIANDIKSKPIMESALINIGWTYYSMKNYSQSKLYYNNALLVAKDTKDHNAIKLTYDNLAMLDSSTGNWKSAYENHKLFILYRDSVFNEENTKKSLQLSMQYEFDKKESFSKAEQEKKDVIQRNIRNSIALGLAGSLFFLMIVFRQRNRVKKEKQNAETEKNKSEELLLNILPSEVADELKATGAAKAKSFTMVTVMFTDFKDFTNVSGKVSAELLVDEIHFCFSAFDNIIAKHKIEKIKTIGDAYLCASGLPITNYTHAVDMLNAAFEIRKFIFERKKEKEAKGEIPFELRIGIHTGPVVAGIVGVKKYAYDIWGDTVNIAARMEQNSDAGKINISGSTYELVKTKFNCVHRGKIEAKNKGMIDMYYVEA